MTDQHVALRPVASQGRSRSSRIARPVSLAVAAVLASAYVFAVDPNVGGHYPLCPFRALTGLDCPGCGATRGMHDLLHGDVIGALDHNILLLGAVPIALVTWFAWVRRSWAGQQRRVQVAPVVVYAGLALIVAFWVVRNLPGVPFLAAT